MSGQEVAYIFVDTNTALHFRRPNEIDWCSLAASGQVVLVAAPVLLRELENQKIVNASRKLRERAGAFIKWLHPFVLDSTKEVRTGVRWLFLASEPQIDFPAERLSLTVADDHLIAAVLEFSRERDEAVFVATADIGLLVKLRTRGVNVLTLPDEMQLPPEPDPLERENRALREEMRRIQSRMPRLVVRFPSGSQDCEVSLLRPRPKEIRNLQEIRSAHSVMMVPDSRPPAPNDPYGFGLRNFLVGLDSLGASEESVRAYNDELREFYAKYENYLRSDEVWQELVGRHVSVEFALANEGSAPATNIDLELSFPAHISPVDADDLPKRPEPPSPPRKPGVFGMLEGYGTGHLSPYHDASMFGARMPVIGGDGTPDVGRDGRSVCISFASLKHGFSETSEKLLLRFSAESAIGSFSIGYRLSADELPEAIVGDLHVRVKGN
ncbi:MAG: PIN domain-containing protein [Parvibaculum sp.]